MGQFENPWKAGSLQTSGGATFEVVAPKHPKHPVDVNALAFQVVGEAVGEVEPVDPDTGKDPAAVDRGRKGGLIGGRARADTLTPEERSAAARKAAAARWSLSEEER